jgi:hypothetical protein
MPEDRVDLAAVVRDIQYIRNEQAAIRQTLDKVSEAISKLAVIKERQVFTSKAIERVMEAMDKLEHRVRALEVEDRVQSKTVDWVDRIIWGILSGFAVFVAYKLGLLK